MKKKLVDTTTLTEAVDAILNGVQHMFSEQNKKFEAIDNRFEKLENKIEFVHSDLKHEISDLKHDTPALKEFVELKKKVDYLSL